MMDKPISPYSLQSAIITRLGILSEMERKLKRVAPNEKWVRLGLEKVVPPVLRQFVEEEGVINLLFDYGSLFTKINFGGRGLKNFDDVSAAMKKLAKAWDKQVAIRLGRPETHRVDVHFGIAQQ